MFASKHLQMMLKWLDANKGVCIVLDSTSLQLKALEKPCIILACEQTTWVVDYSQYLQQQPTTWKEFVKYL